MTMILILSLVVLVMMSIVNAAPLRDDDHSKITLLTEPNTPAAFSQGGPSSSARNDVDVMVIYYDGINEPDRVPYGQCYPYKKNGHLLKSAKFPKLTTCTSFFDEKCSANIEVPMTIPLPPSFNIPNFEGLSTAFGQSFSCREVTVPSILTPDFL
ncbi:unnamed protein product [Absidia cylindrospora]